MRHGSTKVCKPVRVGISHATRACMRGKLNNVSNHPQTAPSCQAINLPSPPVPPLPGRYSLAPFSTRYWAMSWCPSKQAARSGVEWVRVVAFTLTPRSTSSCTTAQWPAAAAHHSGGAPSIVSPSNITAERRRGELVFVERSGHCRAGRGKLEGTKG